MKISKEKSLLQRYIALLQRCLNKKNVRAQEEEFYPRRCLSRLV